MAWPTPTTTGSSMSALADAAALHGTGTADVQLSTRYRKERRELERLDEHCPNYVRQGAVLQVNTVNQFSEMLVPNIKEFNHPTACCGAMSMAHSVILPHVITSNGKVTVAELEALVSELRNHQRLLPQVSQAMRFVHDCRKAYIANHPLKFEDPPVKNHYMSNWVANYEISDYLRREAEGGRLAPNVYFLRYNQWPERSSATHEEKERLVEEQPFGGEVEGDKGVAPLEPWASRFIIEKFVPQRALLSHSEAASAIQGAGNVFVLDLNGHFAIAVALEVLHENSIIEPTLLVVNTTNGSYLAQGIPAVAFDLAFPASGPGPDAFVPSTKEAAVAMGARNHVTIRPLDKCPHVLSAVIALPEMADVVASNWVAAPCQDCQAKNENMLCLQCHAIFCGRYVKQHALAHSTSSEHCLVLGIADLSVWCYRCNNFLDPLLIKDLHPVFSAVHNAKFGHTPVLPTSARSMVEVRFRSGNAPTAPAPSLCDDEKVQQLSSMGFDAQLCKDVLSACGGNVDQAINSLLGM